MGFSTLTHGPHSLSLSIYICDYQWLYIYDYILEPLTINHYYNYYEQIYIDKPL